MVARQMDIRTSTSLLMLVEYYKKSVTIRINFQMDNHTLCKRVNRMANSITLLWDCVKCQVRCLYHLTFTLYRVVDITCQGNYKLVGQWCFTNPTYFTNAPSFDAAEKSCNDIGATLPM